MVVNIKDIAKITGFSISTISRVINDYPYVDEEKRKQVLAVMKDLNFVPNRTAKNLNSGKTQNLGVIVPFTNHPYFDQIIKGITEEAFLNRYKITLLPTDYNEETELEYLNEFAAKGFDGLIITSRANSLEKIIPYSNYGKLVLCENVEGCEIAQVFIDRKESFKEALTYLKNNGVKRLGITLGRTRKRSNNSKITIQACKEIFPDFNESFIYWDCLEFNEGIKAGSFFKNKEVDGILTNGDDIAAGILNFLKKEERIIVIGQENLVVGNVMNFSTIDHQLSLCGNLAFKLFYEERTETIKIPYKFIERMGN